MRDRTVQAAVAAGALALTAAAYVGGQPAPASPAAPDAGRFVGTWKLNPEQSDDFREKMRAARGGREGGRPRSGGPGGGGFGGGFGSGRGGRGGMRGEPGGRDSGDGRASMRRLAEPPDVLTIKTEEGVILVGDDTGTIRRLYPDRRTSKTDNGETQVRSRWDGGALVTETTPAQGPPFKETFALSSDGRQLFVTVDLQPRFGGVVDVRRVYDAAR